MYNVNEYIDIRSKGDPKAKRYALLAHQVDHFGYRGSQTPFAHLLTTL